MTKKFRPKCVQFDRQMAFTSTGFVVPCCWIDSPGGRKDATLKQFYQKDMHIDNFDSIDDIIDSPLYKDWFDMLVNKPELAPNYCKHFCSTTSLDKHPTKTSLSTEQVDFDRVIVAKWGEKYNSWHVNNLKFMLDNYSGIKYNNFVVFEKDTFGNMYNKLEIFNDYKDGTNLYLDLDMVIYDKLPNLVRKDFTLMYDWWREEHHTPLNSSMVSWTGDISHIYKKFVDNKEYYLKKYPTSIDEFYYHEIEYKTFDKVCYSIKEHEYDKEPMKGFGLCTFGQMQHLLEDGWSGWWSKYLNS
jgi:hypothetical protein|tara:strand:+ start:9726 stop:10622 length:897 start_codon:yes stop_codon:yes gene_type:complete